jgi:hypothetical protein
MNRREFIARSALAAAALGTPAAGQEPVVGVTVRRGPSLLTIPPDFMGLGYEISSVARPGLMSGANAVYIQLVQTLGARGVVRVGGNTADYARYTAAGPAVSSPYGTVVDEAGLRELGGFLQATGWKLI